MPGMRGNFIQLSAFFWFLRSDLEKQISFRLHLRKKAWDLVHNGVFTHSPWLYPSLHVCPKVAHYSGDV